VAAAKGRLVVVKLLLKHAAKIDAADRDGHSPLYDAVMADRTQVAQYLVDQGAAIDPDKLLIEVVDSGVTDRDVVEFLLANGANINHLDSSGKTPLILAITNNQRLLTKRLITHGADVNRSGSSGQSPLEVATEVGNQDIIRMLKRNGAR
jgi:ankyrin repeat protein